MPLFHGKPVVIALLDNLCKLCYCNVLSLTTNCAGQLKTVLLFIEGNDKLHQITSQEPQQLRIDLSDFSGHSRYAKYSSFGVADAAGIHRVSVGGYSGTAGRWKCTSYV